MARTINQTTLGAAVLVDDKRVTLASNSTVKVGQVLFVDKEALLVNGPGAVGTALVTGDVPEVQRGYMGTSPQPHATGRKVFTGPGTDFYSAEPSGAAVAANELVLPRVVVPVGKVFDVIDSQWVEVQNDPPKAIKTPVYNYGASGALTVAGGIHYLSKAGVGAMTLAAPAASQDGLEMQIISTTAQAHTVTYATGFGAGGAALDVATFGGAISDNLHIIALGGTWHVKSVKNVTLG